MSRRLLGILCFMTSLFLLAAPPVTAGVGDEGGKSPEGVEAGTDTKPKVVVSSAPDAEQAAEDRTDAEVRGRVLNPEGEPVADATVRLIGKAKPEVVASAEDGTFHATGLLGEEFTIRVEADGFAPFTESKIPAGAAVSVRLKPGHSLGGRVLTREDGLPVAGAEVVACDRKGLRFGKEGCRQATSGDDGRFRVVDLAEGEHWVEVLARARARERVKSVRVPQPVDPDTDEPRELEVFLGPGGRIAGRAVNVAGEPLEGAQVGVTPQDWSAIKSRRSSLPDAVNTDESGRFELDGVPAGIKYTVYGNQTGYATVKKGPFPVEAGTDISDVELRFSVGATLTMRVVDADERPVEEVSLRLLSEEKGRGDIMDRYGTRIRGKNLETGDEGRFTAKHLAPGTYTVRVIPEDFLEEDREGQRLRDGETTDLGTVVVQEGESIAGRVTDPQDRPIAEAEVQAQWMSPEGRFKSRRSSTDEDGTYRISGLSAETLNRVHVKAKGFVAGERRDVTAGDDAVDFALEHTGGVKGRVVRADGAVPQSFSVAAHPEASHEKESDPSAMTRRMLGRGSKGQEFSDAAGSFTLDSIEPGTYTIKAAAEGNAPATKTGVRVVGGQETDVGTLVLERGLTLRGRVVAAQDESPVPGAAINVSTPQAFRFSMMGSDSGRTTSSKTDGTFVIEGLEAGAVSVSAEHPEYSPSETRVELGGDTDPAEVVLRMSQGGTLTGTVRDADGQPVAGAQIWIAKGMFSGETEMITTDSGGRYTYERLAPGMYMVARMPGGEVSITGLAVKNATIEEGRTTVIDFDELARIQLSGRVLRGGQPVGQASLMFVAGGIMGTPRLITALSEEDGRYQVGLDEPGDYQVMVSMRGFGNMSRSSGVHLTVPDEPEVYMDIVVRTAGVTGTVTDDTGSPLEGVTVVARLDGAVFDDIAGQSAAMTGANGVYSLEGVEPGVYRVWAQAHGYPSAEQYPVSVTEGQQQTVDFQLRRGRVLRGRVINPQGQGLAGALVFAGRSGVPDTLMTSPAAQTDVNGSS